MRLIDVDALEDQLGIEDEDIDFRHILEDATTVDAVPAVRCGECKSYSSYGQCQKLMASGLPQLFMKPDDFCSYGERKDGAE